MIFSFICIYIHLIQSVLATEHNTSLSGDRSVATDLHQKWIDEANENPEKCKKLIGCLTKNIGLCNKLIELMCQEKYLWTSIKVLKEQRYRHIPKTEGNNTKNYFYENVKSRDATIQVVIDQRERLHNFMLKLGEKLDLQSPKPQVGENNTSSVVSPGSRKRAAPFFGENDQDDVDTKKSENNGGNKTNAESATYQEMRRNLYTELVNVGKEIEGVLNEMTEKEEFQKISPIFIHNLTETSVGMGNDKDIILITQKIEEKYGKSSYTCGAQFFTKLKVQKVELQVKKWNVRTGWHIYDLKPEEVSHKKHGLKRIIRCTIPRSENSRSKEWKFKFFFNKNGEVEKSISSEWLAYNCITSNLVKKKNPKDCNGIQPVALTSS